MLVGQLLGGAIAARFASRHGARLSRLVLIDTFGLQPFQPTPEFGRALNDMLAQPTEQTHDNLWRKCAFDLDALRRSMGRQLGAVCSLQPRPRQHASVQAALQALMQHFGPAIEPAELDRIGVPTTLIWGRHDLATPLGGGRGR